MNTTQEKPLKKFSYWIAMGKRKGTFDIRCKTRKECKEEMHKSYHQTPRRVTFHYRDMLDLVKKLAVLDKAYYWEY